MIKEGEIITLDNDEEYAVMQEVTINNQPYFILMTEKKPVKIKVCIAEDNDEITLIDDQQLIIEALSKLI